MKQPDMNAEMGLDAYDSRSPGEWLTRVLDRIQDSSRWTVSDIEIGVEDDPDSERFSLSIAHAFKMDARLTALVLASSQVSCFVTAADSTTTWTLPLLLTRDGKKTALTASVYDADLDSDDSAWERLHSLLGLCFDLLIEETTGWLRFGVEGSDLTSADSSIFIVLSEHTWSSVPDNTRNALAPMVDVRPGFLVVWCFSPPGTIAPDNLERYLATVGSIIMTQ